RGFRGVPELSANQNAPRSAVVRRVVRVVARHLGVDGPGDADRQPVHQSTLEVHRVVLEELDRDADDLAGVHVRPEHNLTEAGVSIIRDLRILSDADTDVGQVVRGRPHERSAVHRRDQLRSLEHPTVRDHRLFEAALEAQRNRVAAGATGNRGERTSFAWEVRDASLHDGTLLGRQSVDAAPEPGAKRTLLLLSVVLRLGAILDTTAILPTGDDAATLLQLALELLVPLNPAGLLAQSVDLGVETVKLLTFLA